jgi:alpha-glucosidase/lysosomal alpha-glucosidase
MDYTDVNDTYLNKHITFPYIPGVSPLEKMTLPPNLLHYGKYLHKDVHNLYGL